MIYRSPIIAKILGGTKIQSQWSRPYIKRPPEELAMNKIFDVITITLLIVIANSSAIFAAPSRNPGIVAPTGNSPVAQYECRSRGPSTGQIVLRANNKYDVKHKTGKYQQSEFGYRFLTGPLKRQSIIRQMGNTYLVNTKNEARAAKLAAADGALFCTGGVIYY